jgi:hypothetical protein
MNKDILKKFNFKTNFNEPRKLMNYDKINYENTIADLQEENKKISSELLNFYFEVSFPAYMIYVSLTLTYSFVHIYALH